MHADDPDGVGAGLAPEQILALGDGVVVLLDQTRLPAEVVWRRCADWREVADAIRELAVRGAPAIGIAGAMGVALAAQHGRPRRHRIYRVAVAAPRTPSPRTSDRGQPVMGDSRQWRSSTAIPAHRGDDREPAPVRQAPASAEVARCRAMGARRGAGASRGADPHRCNTGALATGGIGTALGVIRSVHAGDPTVRVLVDETRPLLQGARLTAWELARDQIPYALIADAMAAR